MIITTKSRAQNDQKYFDDIALLKSANKCRNVFQSQPDLSVKLYSLEITT